MKIDNPLAYRYILQDDIYLLNDDKAHFADLRNEEPAAETPAITFNYLGGNKKNFLVLTFYTDAEFMHQQHLQALESTLNRLSIELNDVAVLNISNYGKASVDDLLNFFNPKKLLVLGKSALPAVCTTLTPNKYNNLNSCKTLYTFSFDQMMDKPEYKKVFWELMKQF